MLASTTAAEGSEPVLGGETNGQGIDAMSRIRTLRRLQQGSSVSSQIRTRLGRMSKEDSFEKFSRCASFYPGTPNAWRLVDVFFIKPPSALMSYPTPELAQAYRPRTDKQEAHNNYLQCPQAPKYCQFESPTKRSRNDLDHVLSRKVYGADCSARRSCHHKSRRNAARQRVEARPD